MPILTKTGLPVNGILRKEKIQILEGLEGRHYFEKTNEKVLQIAILNLMPLKEDTELQLLRKLSTSGKSIKITFVNVISYISKTTAPEHMERFYSTFEEIKDKFRTLLCNKTINLGDEDLRKVREIEKSYITENFVSKQTSKWNVVRKGRVNGCGNLEVYMQVKHGNIERVELSGDYFQLKDSVGDLTDSMRGAQFTIESLKSVFLKYPPENYIRGLKGKDMIKILFD